MGRSVRGVWLAALCLLLPGGLTGRTGLAATAAAGSGAVWQLRGAHNTVYLAGSLHALPAGSSQLPPTLLHAYDDAESLVMEIDPDESDPARIGAVMLEKGRYAGNTGLQAAVGESRWARLQPWIQRHGLPAAMTESLEPWALALVLTSAEFARLGVEPGSGVEEQLRARARAQGKSIAGLETAEFQLGLFDALSPAEQLELLDGTLEDLADAGAEFGRLAAAWRSGDEAALESLLQEAYAGMPDLYEALVYRRNAAWVPRVLALLDGREDVLVVVGALHLVGDRGLVALLRRAGARVERVTVH